MGEGRFARGFGRLRPALVVLAIGAALALIPTTTCLLRLTFDVPCPACGLTRAALALAHLDFAAAQRWHPLAIPLLAVTCAVVPLAFLVGDAAWRRLVVVTTGAAGVLLVVVWVLRFVGLFGGPVPG
jgi:hypothetical protein